uniref:Nucleophosmin/nucleoplasmin 2 n=1 Tax=Coturnix japonica TaxID=93934 RepID=A0A8C2TTW6_COTJA
MPFMGWGGSPSDPLYGGGLHLTLFVPIGCELSSERSSYTFQMPEEWQCEQQLALRTICLGAQARDEFHVLELVPNEEGAAVPLATLKPSVLPMVTLVGVELTPPVTFRLRAGSGPVYISGQHVASKTPTHYQPLPPHSDP